jgi:carbamoylphosphate synthase large subunit
MSVDTSFLLYNIVKPSGGYLTFKFACRGLETKNEPVVRIAGTSTKQNITITKNADTKYTNLINVNGLGNFQLSVRYTSSLYEINGKALAAAAQINFTL